MIESHWSDGPSTIKTSKVFQDMQELLKNKWTQRFEKVDASTPFYKVISPVSLGVALDQYRETALEIRQRFKTVVIIGMGGASLNPRVLLEFLPPKEPNIYFLDSTDPLRFNSLMDGINLGDTVFLVVSNSGETVETILLLKAVLREYKLHGIKNSCEHFLFITGQKASTLRALAEGLGCKIYDHESEISGRYCSFTNVVILPGLIAGLDMPAFLKGAQSVLEDFRQKKEQSSPAISAAMIMALGRTTLVNVGYLRRFNAFLEWYSQIIAESLGKGGKGFTPLPCIAPEAHHSVFQLYLGGAKDKTFTLFYAKNLPNQAMQSVNNAAYEAATMALEEQRAPFQTVIIKDLSEASIGSLMAHSIAEVILLGELLQVNPFDQPHVEMIKKYLSKLTRDLA